MVQLRRFGLSLLQESRSMSVVFKCKSCGAKHNVSIGFTSRQHFATGALRHQLLRCPKTHGLEDYSKEEIEWRDDGAPAKARS
jgi:hypothetical protein